MLAALTGYGLAKFKFKGRNTVFMMIMATMMIPFEAILSFRGQWVNLLWPLLVSQSDKMKTIPQYISNFALERSTDEGVMMAAALLASIPMFLLFMSLTKYFIGGSVVYESRKG